MKRPWTYVLQNEGLVAVVLAEYTGRTKLSGEVQTMRHKILLLIALVFLFSAAFVFSPVPGAEADRGNSVKAGEPASHFQKADELFLKKNLKAAASEIRKGAGFLKQKAKSATADSKEELSASARELERLAGDVQKGGVTSEKQLKDAFARSYMPWPIPNIGRLQRPGPRKRREKPAKPLRMQRKTWSKLQSGPVASWKQTQRTP